MDSSYRQNMSSPRRVNKSNSNSYLDSLPNPPQLLTHIPMTQETQLTSHTHAHRPHSTNISPRNNTRTSRKRGPPPGLALPINQSNTFNTNNNHNSRNLFTKLLSIIQQIQPSNNAYEITSKLCNEFNDTQLKVLMHNQLLLQNKIESIAHNQSKHNKIRQLLSSPKVRNGPTKPPFHTKKRPKLPPGLEIYVQKKNRSNAYANEQLMKEKLYSLIKQIEPELAYKITQIIVSNTDTKQLLFLLSQTHETDLLSHVRQIKANLSINGHAHTQYMNNNSDNTQFIPNNSPPNLPKKPVLKSPPKPIQKSIDNSPPKTPPNLNHKTCAKSSAKLIQKSPPKTPKTYADISSVTPTLNPSQTCKQKHKTLHILNDTHRSPQTHTETAVHKRQKSQSPHGSVSVSPTIENEIIESEDKYLGLPPVCWIQVFRICVNTVIPKQIFELFLEAKCIDAPNSKQKIFVRCHKSHYYENSTVLYVHFINFSQEHYEFCRDQYFDFRNDANEPIIRYNFSSAKPMVLYTKNTKQKKTLFEIMGNELQLIKVYKAKEYEPFKANLSYLSRIVSICLRCKINKAAARKRVCTFCISDERNDRIKIAEYYNNPESNAKHKMNEEIQRDLVNKLKIELNLIPLMYRSECNNYDAINGIHCGNKKCSFTHNSDERIFGEKLHEIRIAAIKRQYQAQGSFELSDYSAVKLQLKYRKIIGKYYNLYWKYNKHKILAMSEDCIASITKYLLAQRIELYLIPTLYKNWCYYAKDLSIDRLCSKKSPNIICTFIHNDKEELFGDILWRIKYDALQERERNTKHMEYMERSAKNEISLIDDENGKNKPDGDVNDSVRDDKWWREVIEPYMEANEEEHTADKDLAEQWRIDDSVISIKAEEISYLPSLNDNYESDSDDSDSDDSDSDREEGRQLLKHVLYVEYEDDKSAKINPQRTYVDFTIKCRYKINFEMTNMEESIRCELRECALIAWFMSECQSMAVWAKNNESKIYKHFRSRVHILNIIASFAVIPNKNFKDCIACYFNVCDGIKHKSYKGKAGLRLYRNCCSNDFEKDREHDFDTRKCEQLHGVVIEKINHSSNDINHSGNGHNPRYKVLINKKKTNIDTYLKFLIIGSDKFAAEISKYMNIAYFKDVLVTYPCNTHQFIQINEKLKLLHDNEQGMHRTNRITQIVFGYKNSKPLFMRNIDSLYANQHWRPKNISAHHHMYGGQHIDKPQISELFRKLNDSQVSAIYGALNYNLHTIQGPPATGKTNTCAHIAYLWWLLNTKRNAKNKRNVKIHGMTPTNQGTLLLAQKCSEMNEIMAQAPTLRANTICDGFIRSFYGNVTVTIPTTIRDLLLKFYYVNRNPIKRKKFKVIYFASQTYTNILDIKVTTLTNKKNFNQFKPGISDESETEGMTMVERLCVNLAATHKLKKLPDYDRMNERKKQEWKNEYIWSELESADMICTTFGNSTHKTIRELFEEEFTHAIADECNQSSLDTFLGILGYVNLRYLCMAGDIKQLSPVTRLQSQNQLTNVSVYEYIIRYLTRNELEPNEYYTRLNKQYRSHPQIYRITTQIFYNSSVDINADMQYIREYKRDKLGYSKLFAKAGNHIQFHMLTNRQKQKGFDTSQTMRHSKYNIIEAQTAVKYLKKFLIELRFREEEIAVISDYAAQVDCVYTLLTRIKGINEDKILLCTTNEIEGSSKPIVIYMCCRSNDTGNIGFLNDITRVNVATSRAEYGQIIIGDIYTLQYNPIYKQIFDIHQRENAVVYEDNTKTTNKKPKKKHHKNKGFVKQSRTNKNKYKNVFNLKTVSAHIPLVNISKTHFFQKKQDLILNFSSTNSNGKIQQNNNNYFICGGCNRYIFAKLFCGRVICAPPIFIYYCQECINAYLCEYMSNTVLYRKFSFLSAMTIIPKTDLNCNRSFGIKLEFDLLLGRKLIENGLIKFTNFMSNSHSNDNGNRKLYLKFIRIVTQIVKKEITEKKYRERVPECFQILAEYKENDINTTGKCDIRSDINRNKAIGIIQCKRNHLLKQAIMDSKFFRLVYSIKNCKPELQSFYKYNKYTFYKYREFEENQPTLIVIAYLKACGYSTNIANYLHKRVSKQLFDKNVTILSRHTRPMELSETEIEKLVEYLKLDQLIGTCNALSRPIGEEAELSGYYVIKLMQCAIIDDPMSGYYERRKYETAIAKEHNFGDDLKSVGFDYYSEQELLELGYKCTPDYYLKKPWIVEYHGLKYEITWIDFKYFYCSSTQWIIDKLRFQAQKYNKVFGPGAFVFSLGFVKVPSLLSLNSHGLLAALPLSKELLDTFINETKKQREQ